MAGGTIWTGYIHFGDMNVPVKLHTAVKENRIQFHLLHQRDRVKLQQQMICAYEKVPVPREEQAKGFEVEERKYILIDPLELEQTEPESSRIIEVHEFIKPEQIDPIFLEGVYYLEPDTLLKGYNALVGALARDGGGRHLHLDHAEAVLFRGLAGPGETSSPPDSAACRRSDFSKIS